MSWYLVVCCPVSEVPSSTCMGSGPSEKLITLPYFVPDKKRRVTVNKNVELNTVIMMGVTKVDTVRPLDIKRLNVRNNHHTMETDKKVQEMRKHSNSLLNSYDKDIEEMREKYGRLQTVQTPDAKIRKSPEPKAGRGTPVQEVTKRQSARASSLKGASSKQQSTLPSKSFKTSSLKVKRTTSATESHAGSASPKPNQTFPRSKTSTSGTKKRSSSMKKKASDAEYQFAGQKKVSHSYCERIVYDSDTGETISDGGYLQESRRPRSTSMFDTESERVTPIPIIEDREMNRILEERSGRDRAGAGKRGERKRSMTLDEALLQLGDSCPYKDLIS